jgi:flagellar M-ring protein FliF
MQKLIEQIKAFAKEKPLIIFGGAALAAALIAVVLLMNQGPEYQSLYTQLSPEDSGAVIEKLKEKRVPYKVDGSTISVPADKVYETRMELAGEGLPQGGGVGFEIFDKTAFGVTDFVQKINYKRALQGELSRTITQIKEIDTARVHLALPEKGVFLDEQKKARASVIVKLKPGKQLTQGQVSSIVHLVANSTDNLKPEDVAVVDTAGKMWTREADEDSGMMLSATQLEYKRSLEKDYEYRVQSMLERAVGMDNVVARVAADVDTRHVERTEERYDPDGQVVRSEQKSKESSVGGIAALGVPGVLSNMPETAQANKAQVSAAPPSSHRQNDVVNYEISKVTSHVVEPTGAIKRLTVSVLVDGTYQASSGAEAGAAKSYVPRTEEELAKFTEMVKGAVGYNEGRGDVISVVSTPFEQGLIDAELAPEKAPLVPAELVPVILKYATVVIITLIVMLFVVRPVLKRLTSEKKALEEIQRSMPALGGGAEYALEAGQQDIDSVDRLKRVVRENPQQVAMVLKSWIKEK